MVPPGPGPVPGLGGRPSATVWRSRWWSPGAGPGSSRWARVWARLPGRGCGLLCLTDGEWVLFMTEASEQGARRPGPRRAEGAPSGPDQVRRAVLDAAALLFAQRGVDRVSLRDVAAAADVHLALIGRYVGSRDALVLAVFDDLSSQLAEAVLEHPLSGQGFGADTVMGKWVRVASALAIAGQPLAGRGEFNPVLAMAETLAEGYGIDSDAARLRAAQIVAAALGWRIFEDYLVAAGGLGDVPLDRLRDELARSARRLGGDTLALAARPTAKRTLTAAGSLRTFSSGPIPPPRPQCGQSYTAVWAGRREPRRSAVACRGGPSWPSKRGCRAPSR